MKVLNYEKFKGRTDVKHNTWFRCSNRLLEDPDFFEFTHSELLVWVHVMSLTSQKNCDTVFINFSHAEKVCRLKKRDVLSAIKKLEGIQLVPVRDTHTLRARYADVTHTCATGQDRTLQDNTEQDTTGQADFVEPDRESSLPWLVELWNQMIFDLPKVTTVSKKRNEKIKARIKERPSQNEWKEIFTSINISDFLSGRAGDWAASFDWVIKNEENHVKIFEGNYKNKTGAKNRPQTFQEIRTAKNAELYNYFESKAANETKE